MLAVEPGFSTDRALALQLAVPASSAPASRRAFFQQVVTDTEQLPGVVAAGLVSELPLALQFNDVFFHVEGRPPESAAQRVVANYRRVTPGYFRAMEIPLRRGRLPTASEVERRAPVALIDERLADRFLAAEDPIGRRVVVEFGEPLTLEIVGVVGSILDGSWRREPHQTIYVPDVETPLSMTLVARTAGPPGELASARPGSIPRMPCGTSRDARAATAPSQSASRRDVDPWRSVRKPPISDTALLRIEFHEHPRVAMTNSVCSSGRDSTRPRGASYGQGTGRSLLEFFVRKAARPWRRAGLRRCRRSPRRGVPAVPTVRPRLINSRPPPTLRFRTSPRARLSPETASCTPRGSRPSPRAARRG